MPESNQIAVTHKELIELIIKHAGIHDGRWILMANFGIGSGNYGPSPEQIVPGVLVALNQIGIQRVPAEATPPQGITVDAAVANPKAKAPKAPKTPRHRKANPAT